MEKLELGKSGLILAVTVSQNHQYQEEKKEKREDS